MYEILSRLETQIPHTGTKCHRTKLFRVEQWVDLCFAVRAFKYWRIGRNMKTIMKTSYWQNSIFFHGPSTWNSIDLVVRTSTWHGYSNGVRLGIRYKEEIICVQQTKLRRKSGEVKVLFWKSVFSILFACLVFLEILVRLIVNCKYPFFVIC